MEYVAHALALLKLPSLLGWAPVFAIGFLIERIAPAEKSQPLSHLRLNVAYALVNALIVTLANPRAGAIGIGIVNACGGGLIPLSDQGWALVGSAALFVAAMDFMEYVFHRAQHGIPFLWAMHSLHHSEPSVNVTTTTRAFWIEPAIKAIFIYPVVGVLFHVTPAVYGIYGLTQLYHFVNHLNLRVHFGKFWVVLNGPQYHRIHHSASPEHFDRNFAAFFPIFDFMFRTSHRPMPDEFPSTGLDTRDVPRNALEAAIWPFRSLRSRGRIA
jgi:sterol desaturase/sphingolipid hydroxylase (fatty acid hydroxylase superfamily)